MTNFEINKAVAKRLPVIINCDQSASLKAKSSSVLVNDIVSTYELNFCENWADAGPIIEKYGITLVNMYDDGWEAHVIENQDEACTSYSACPRIAAMLVFLAMEVN
jgi:hypothetical protein